jgi:hypothetical protein
MKNKIAIILSIFSITIALSVVGLWIFGTFELTAISLETFIGIVVALLAIIFSIIVGWEIINAIDVKERMSKLEQRQDAIMEIERRIVENQQNYAKGINNLQSGISGASAELYVAQNRYFEAFCSYHSALHNAIIADTPNQLNRINQLQLICVMITSLPTIDTKASFKQIVFETDEIRKTNSYRNCFAEFYEQTMANFWQKMQFLGLTIPEKR